jgi:hypothetical protein
MSGGGKVDVVHTIAAWFARLDDVQKRQRVRCESRTDILAIARRAAILGRACSDRVYVGKHYPGTAWQTEIMAYRDDALGVVRLTSYRRRCGTMSWGGGVTTARVSAAEAERVTAGAPALPVAIAARLTHTGLPGEAYALYDGPRRESAQPYDAAGHRMCRAWVLPREWRVTGSRWWHAETRRAAETEIVRAAEALAWAEDYERTWQAAIQEDQERSARKAAKAERRERLLARLTTTLSACWEDALAAGYCQAGIRAWASQHGIAEPETARVPLRELVADEDRRAQALALEMARRAISAAGRG